MKTLIVANWKCNPVTFKEAKYLLISIQKIKSLARNLEVVVCPPFVYLSGLQNKFKNFKLGAQNCFWEEKGAFTGEVSAKMLKDIGCKYVIVGHSERRRYFLETYEIINKKLKIAIENKLKPILCVGETQEERTKGLVAKILNSQINIALRGIKAKDGKQIIIAYEPVWAIGTGNNCLPKDAQQVRLLIKKIITQKFSRVLANRLAILYGGSVNSSNGVYYIKEAGFQGLLVGGASLDPKEFIRLLNSIQGKLLR